WESSCAYAVTGAGKRSREKTRRRKRAEGIQVERKERNMSESLDASLSGFVNVLGVLVFVSITVYHVVTANRKDIAS
ncbi:unnamed protein product, partial [Ectocarpus sp. 8 AP-2014]